MYIPELDSAERRAEIAASEAVAAMLEEGRLRLYYAPLGHCAKCGDNDAVQTFIDGTVFSEVPMCAQEHASLPDAEVSFPILRGFLRRLGVDTDSFTMR
jgi:hypothetical protein